MKGGGKIIPFISPFAQFIVLFLSYDNTFKHIFLYLKYIIYFIIITVYEFVICQPSLLNYVPGGQRARCYPFSS